MPQLLIAAVVAAGIVVGLYFFVLTYSQRLVRGLVEDKHRDGEMIGQTRLAPPSWRSSLLVRLATPRMRRRYALRRIDRLIGYFRTTSMVDSEATRTLIVDELAGVRDEWRSMTWEEICPYR